MTEETSSSTFFPVTSTFVCAWCIHELSSGERDDKPSPKQLAFFTLVWAAKHGVRVELPDAYWADEDGALLTEKDVRSQISLIREQLAVSGAVVDQLQRKEEKTWELLRIQLEKPIRATNCRLTDKQDALGSVALKIWELLVRIPRTDWIESFPDATTAAANLGGAITRIYDFTSPFYAYASRMARNELISILRKKQAPADASGESDAHGEEVGPIYHEPGYEYDFDLVVNGPAGGTLTQIAEAQHEQAFLAMRAQVVRLVDEIGRLPARQRQVMQLTLVARPQFFRALSVLELPTPPNIAEQASLLADRTAHQADPPDDRAIAACMGCNTNLVGVTRHNAMQRICRQDPEQCNLLIHLIEPRRAKADKHVGVNLSKTSA